MTGTAPASADKFQRLQQHKQAKFPLTFLSEILIDAYGIYWQDGGYRCKLDLPRLWVIRRYVESQSRRRVSEMQLVRALVRVARENERRHHG